MRSALSFALLVVAVPLAAAPARALTCDPANPVQNTANVLCGQSHPSTTASVCTAASVTVKDTIVVTDAGCDFDLGGRTLQFQKEFQMTGLGYIKVFNVGSVSLTGTARLKARGDFVEPNAVTVQGGLISLVSAGTVSVANGAVIDVSGDPSGTITITAAGADPSASTAAINLQSGSTLQGKAVTSVVDTGDRFSDGGTVELTATAGSIFDGAALLMSGTNQGQGGEVDMTAAKKITVATAIDATGGGSDGGSIDFNAGDDIVVTKAIDVSSVFGGGCGGSICISAGLDEIGVPGGAVGGGMTLDGGSGILRADGVDSGDTGQSSGDGGDIEVDASGTIQFINAGTRTLVHADGGPTYVSSGGTFTVDAGDPDPYLIGPLDGDVVLNGAIHMASGKLGGDGGEVDVSAGKTMTINSPITLTGVDNGGDVSADSGGTMTVNGAIDVHATSAPGESGSVDFESGLAQGGSAGALTVANDVIATAGSTNGGTETLSFAGCTLTIDGTVKVDGTGGTSPTNVKGGADIELIAVGAMTLSAGSQFLAPPGGVCVITHPPGQIPQRSGAIFNPAPIDNARPLDTAFYPNCPVCGDGIRQLGEVCDKGAAADGACCNSTCTALVCATTTPTATPTPIRTATVTATPTATATLVAVGPTPTPPATSSATPAASATPVVTATAGTPAATPSATATAVATATTTATRSPTVTPTATVFATATSTATTTASATPSRTPSPTATSTPTISATAAETPSVAPPSATPGETGTTPVVTPTPVFSPLVAKAIDKCQRGITHAGATYVAKRLKSFDKCANGVLRCVQTTPTDACFAKAVVACDAEMTAKRDTLVASFRSTIAGKCTNVLVADADLLSASGLDFDGIATQCQDLFATGLVDLGTITQCLLNQHDCEAGQLFAAQAPRAGEMFDLIRGRGATFDSPACLTDLGAAGAVAADGKDVDKCAEDAHSAAATFLAAKLANLALCSNGLLACDVKEPGNAACKTKAQTACTKALAKIVAAGDKLSGLGARCTVDIATLGAATGLNLDALAAECATLNVPVLDSVGAYATCLLRQHTCRGEDLVRFEAPRAEELLGALTPPVPLRSAFCPPSP